jgi:predicted DNA-binding protein with PD1-like motif
MKAALLHEHEGLRSFAVVLARGDEAMAALTAFAIERELKAAQFTAIGALSRVVVAYFDWITKQYRHITIDEQVEVLSLIGDITFDGGKLKVHAHIVVSKADATAHGGHLIEGHVRPTLEIVLTEMPRHLQRRFDPESGLTLIDPTAAARPS